MKALLYKNFYILRHQLLLPVIIMLILAILPTPSAAFAIIWMAVLPMNIISYDHASRWERLEKMMPYTARDIVLSKYILGYTAISACTLLSVISITVCSLVNVNITTINVPTLLAVALASTIMMSVSLPVILKFGPEKGRWMNIIFVMVFVSIFTIISGSRIFGQESYSAAIQNGSLSITAVIFAAAAAIAINILSIMISIRIQKKAKAD